MPCTNGLDFDAVVEKVGGSFDAKCARREITGEMHRLLGRFFVSSLDLLSFGK